MFFVFLRVCRNSLQISIAACLAFVITLHAQALYAAETTSDQPLDLRGSEIQMFFENDSFGNSDQYLSLIHI